MTILDRYILKQFAINFAILFLVLFLFTCIVDLFLNLDRFVEAAEQMAGAEAQTQVERVRTVSWLVLDFYGPRVFQFFAFLVGIVTVGAVGFTLVQLHRHRELVAVLAAGVSLHRVAMPLIIAGLALSTLQFINREVMLPRMAPRLLRSHGQLGQSDVGGFRVSMVADGLGNVFYAANYSPDEQRMEDVIVWRFGEQGGVDSRATARAATWDGRGWTFTDGTETRTSLASGEVLRAGPIDRLDSDLDPTTLLLHRHREYRQMLSLGQISDLLSKPEAFRAEQLGELMRVRYGRFAQLVINLLTLLIALPFFLLREPRNLLVQSVKCALVTLPAQIGGAVGTVVGLSGVPASLSVFLVPLLILLPLAVFMMNQVET